MGKIKLEFPDGALKEYEAGITAREVIEKDIGVGLLRAALAAKVGDKAIDLNAPIAESGKFKVLTLKDKEGLEVFRHSTAHVLAQAIVKLFPKAIPTIGPVVEEGFYYDFDSDPFTPQDVEKIEKEMEAIVKADHPFARKDVSKSEAKKIFSSNPYKLELIDEFEGDSVGVYSQGDYQDLCRGPHVPSTGVIKSFKIMKIAGAYWRGDAKNKQLQRVYGISFGDKKQLEAHLKMIEEAEKRDHRKIGKDQNLFMTHEYAPGMPFFLPKGMVMLIELTKFVRKYSYGEGYKEVRTPQLFNAALWKESGHWDHYRQNMFCLHHVEDNTDMALKAMNCPGHMLVFRRDTHSYKDLPLRIAETTTLYRNELSGTLAGLTRVRALSQDDTHIFLAKEQIFEEIQRLIEKIKMIYKIFDLNIAEIYLSTMPIDHMGEEATWREAEENLKKALEDANLKYTINEGDGAFYGPKIDVQVKDALGRLWQLATIQLDFQLPARFGLLYTDADGSRKTPVVIHRALLGTMERFLGIITEHYSGKFPLWLSAVQVKILSVADRFNSYAYEVCQQMIDAGIRAEVDDRTESIPKKVRDAQLEQINYILVVGERELGNKTVTVRTRDNKVLGEEKIDPFVDKLLKEIEEMRN